MEIWQGDLFSVTNLQPVLSFYAAAPSTLADWRVFGIVSNPLKKELVEEIEGVWVNPSLAVQSFVLKSQGTSDWPIGKLSFKLKFISDNDEVIHGGETSLTVKEL